MPKKKTIIIIIIMRRKNQSIKNEGAPKYCQSRKLVYCKEVW